MPLSSGGSTGGGGSLGNGSVTNAMLAAAPANSLLVNNTASSASPTNLTLTDNQIVGKEISDTLQGLNLYYGLLTANHNLFATTGSLYKFSTLTTDADPGVGTLRFNSATTGSITKLWIDDLDYKSNSIVTRISSAITSDMLLYRSTSTPHTVFGVLTLTSSTITNKTGYREVSVAFKAGTLPGDNEVIELVHIPVGHVVAGFTGTQGDKAGIRSTFITDTTNTNIVAGKTAFNNATLASVTQIFIHETGQGAIDLTNWYDNMITNGYLYFSSNSNADNSQAIFKISGAQVDSGVKRTIPVTYISGSTNFSNNEEIVINYTPGDPGSAVYNQASDVPAPTSNNGLVVIVKNPGNNAAADNPVPWTMFSDGTRWKTTNGYAQLAYGNEPLGYICTATQPTSYTAVDANNVRLTWSGGHGLTPLGTDAWASPWLVPPPSVSGLVGLMLPMTAVNGWDATGYAIANVEDANNIIVSATSAGKTLPTLVLANNNITVKTVQVPWMNLQSRLLVNATLTSKTAGTGVTRRIKLRYATVEFYNYNLGTTATPIATRVTAGLNTKLSGGGYELYSSGSSSGSGTVTSVVPRPVTFDGSVYQPLDIQLFVSANEPIILDNWEVQVCL